MAAEGYRAGVPMGSILPAAKGGKSAPTFLVSAAADPGTTDAPGHLLQRLQIIKGWLGENDDFHQQVIDIAGDAGNSADVDLASCAPVGDGFANLCAVWQDPEFDPDQDAVYYARVVENPSCRWSARMCL